MKRKRDESLNRRRDKNLNRRRGVLAMLGGVVLIAVALFMLLRNINESNVAGDSSDRALRQVVAAIPVATAEADDHGASEQDQGTESNGAYESSASNEMAVRAIDGHAYIGYLEIPELDLALPIMSSWDYEKLRIAPCRQFGSTKSDDLVIAGHNYTSHFGKLSMLDMGDQITFTDMDGVVTVYDVGLIEVLEPTAVDVVRNSQWDLTLYTCTYGAQDRVVVRAKALN